MAKKKTSRKAKGAKRAKKPAKSSAKNAKNTKDASCPITGECGAGGMAKCLVPIIAVALTIFGFEWIFHGIIMMPQYEATADMWRSQAEAESLFYICIIRMLVIASIFSCLYCNYCKASECGGGCPVSSMKFGAKIGLLIGTIQAGQYVWLPIPQQMALYWLGGAIVEGALIGLVLWFVCQQCMKHCDSGK